MMGWPDTADDVLAGDQAIVLAYATPAGGVVCAPVTNFGQRDRETATVTVNSSVGMPRKLERIRHDPRVALAFHTRQHGFSDRADYILLQGRATLSAPVPDYPAVLGTEWERFDGPRATDPFWTWWLRIYYTRVEIQVAIERVVIWPDLACDGAPEVHGTPMPADPPQSQSAPVRGTAPRLDHVSAATKAARLPHVLLGWLGADNYPVVAPVNITDTDSGGMVLTTPQGLVPPGGRRAGLTAHSFTRYVLGQTQQIHTGWLDNDHDRIHYAPHTQTGHRLPPSQLVYRLAVGYGTRRGVRTRQGR